MRSGSTAPYGAYLDRIPGVTLATVNLISRFGLHRALRGALAGPPGDVRDHLAAAEPQLRRGAAALREPDDAIDFFDEHVEADSVHEQVAARDLAQGLALDRAGRSPQQDRLRRRVAADARIALGRSASRRLGGRRQLAARAERSALSPA